MCKRSCYLLVGMLLAHVHWGFGQEPLSLTEADRLTYNYYLQKNWPQLLQTGKQALHQGIDFYYLRVRMGIACYELQNYDAAIRHFKAAQAMSTADDYVAAYLYFAYLYNGRRMDALQVAQAAPAAVAESWVGSKPKGVAQADVYFNQNMVDETALLRNFTTAAIPAEDGQQFFSTGHRYYYAGLAHELGRGLFVYHAYTGVQKQHYLFERIGSADVRKPGFQSTLHQYAAAATLRLGTGVQLRGGFHYVNASYPELRVVNRPGNTTQLIWVQQSTGAVVLGAGLAAQFPYVRTAVHVYTGNLNGLRQLQADALVVLFPLGNNRLYSATRLTAQRESIAAQAVQRMIVEQQLGGQLARPLWAEAYLATGPQHNYIAGDGFVLFNAMDVIRLRTGLRLFVFPISRLRLHLEGSLQQSEGVFTPANNIKPTYNPVSFQNHSITGGITWYF